jgi:CubicO group peptidase (beta-lactamase class C family)
MLSEEGFAELVTLAEDGRMRGSSVVTKRSYISAPIALLRPGRLLSAFGIMALVFLTQVTVPAAWGQAGSGSVRALEQTVPELMRKNSVPGLSLALIRNGKIYWVKSFGVKDGDVPVTNETIFEAASLSKVVFAYAVLKLVDQGKIDLDAPLQRYLNGPYIEGDPRIDKITARMVLSHRTGFPNWRPKEGLAIHFEPGDHFSYSGEGFVFLAKAVERITGQNVNEFMRQTVFTPLGMSSSSYVWREDYDARTAIGHDKDGGAQEKWKPKEANPASSLQTTALDYARFMTALLDGKGLRPETLKQMETPQTAVQQKCTVNCFAAGPLSKSVFWGLGVGLEKTSIGPAFWHWGDNGAFKAYMVGFPRRKSGLVMFTNSENGLGIADAVVKAAFGADQPSLQWLRHP